MPKISQEETKKKLNDEGQKFAEKLLSNPALVDLVNKAWEDPEVNKINWKELKRVGTGSVSEKKSAREGYYSVIFLENKGVKEPYLITTEIARGGKALLKNAYNLNTGEHVALKIVREVTDDNPIQAEEHSKEIEGLTFTKRYKGQQKRVDKHYLAQDYIRGRDLDKYAKDIQNWMMGINRESHETLGLFNTVLKIMTSTLFEIHKLHQEGYVHRDLKGGNLMLLENPNAGISDSKVAQVLPIDFGGMDKNSGELKNVSLGTKVYLAPELKKGDMVPFSQPSDVYAIGLVLKELVGFLDNNVMKVYFLKKNKDLKKDAETIVSKIKDLISKMTEEDPKQRITATEAFTELYTILSQAKPAFSELITEEMQKQMSTQKTISP